MYSNHAQSIICTLVALVSLPSLAFAQASALVDTEYTLGGTREAGSQLYEIETRMTTFTPEGERTRFKLLRLRLRCEVEVEEGAERETCTALDYFLTRGEEEPVTIPALEGWTYEVRGGTNEEEQSLFGIDHALFEGMTDSEGAALAPDESFYVLNSFIDFHMFDQVFAARSTGAGIQDLRQIGDRIVHHAAFSEPTVRLGSTVADGSVFRNGEITLHFKGLGVIDERPCALIGYDSGESSFDMIMDLMPNMRVTTTGASHYQGDMYVDLQTNWFVRGTLHELVVSETILPVPPGKVNSVIEREIVIVRADEARER